MHAFSSACHAVSSNQRCCGSIQAASWGGTRKNVASKSSGSIPSIKPPQSGFPFTTRFAPEPWIRPLLRSTVAREVTASLPSASSRQNAWGSLASPGNRHPIPMMAMSSDCVITNRHYLTVLSCALILLNINRQKMHDERSQDKPLTLQGLRITRRRISVRLQADLSVSLATIICVNLIYTQSSLRL